MKKTLFKYILLLSLSFVLSSSVFAQNKVQNLSIGPEFRSNGFGAVLTADISNHLTFIKKQIVLNVGSLRHSKELKITNANYSNPKPYIYRKLNNVFTINPSLSGSVLFGKPTSHHPLIRLGLELGPSFAVARPYFVFVQHYDNANEFRPKKVAYRPELNYMQNEILAGAGWNNGFNDLSISTGISGTITAASEWKDSFHLQRVKATLNMTYFPRDLQILQESDNQFFASIGFSYQIGLSH